MTTAPRNREERVPSGQLLTGHIAEWNELLGALDERRGVTVVVGDPLSGTSGLLKDVLQTTGAAHAVVDARDCAGVSDLAMAIADSAVEAFEADAVSWWVGAAPPSSTEGLQLSRKLAGIGIAPFKDPGPRGAPLADALEILAAIRPDRAVLVVDHLGTLLANLREQVAREVLDSLRTTQRAQPGLDLMLVDHPGGPIDMALEDPSHPLWRGAERLHIRRPTPERMAGDLAITKPLVGVDPRLLRAAAELCGGSPSLTWQVVALAQSPQAQEPAALAAIGFSELRRINAVSVAREWELLRRVHPSAQTIVAALSLGIPPHRAPAASKTIDDALRRLRDVGVVWQPDVRRWVVADQLLAAHARDHAPPWTRRVSARAR